MHAGRLTVSGFPHFNVAESESLTLTGLQKGGQPLEYNLRVESNDHLKQSIAAIMSRGIVSMLATVGYADSLCPSCVFSLCLCPIPRDEKKAQTRT